MKQSLQLKISQHLTMTPQLQQAIRLLQLSTVDLQQEIQTMVETNPMLEVPEVGDELGSPETSGEQPGDDTSPDSADSTHKSDNEGQNNPDPPTDAESTTANIRTASPRIFPPTCLSIASGTISIRHR